MADPASLRVADSDREQLADELREHMLAGRLTSAEFEQRVGRAYAATTREQLDALKADLPLSSAALELALAKRKARLRRRLIQEAGGALGVSALCVAIWLASGASGAFWPLWVLLLTLLPVVRNAWRLLGPEPDLEALEVRMNARRARRLAREHARSHRQLPR